MSVKIVSWNITKNHRATFRKHLNNTIRFSMIIDLLIKEEKKKIQKLWKVTYQTHKVPSFCIHGSLKRTRWLTERRGTRGLGVAEARGRTGRELLYILYPFHSVNLYHLLVLLMLNVHEPKLKALYKVPFLFQYMNLERIWTGSALLSTIKPSVLRPFSQFQPLSKYHFTE